MINKFKRRFRQGGHHLRNIKNKKQKRVDNCTVIYWIIQYQVRQTMTILTIDNFKSETKALVLLSLPIIANGFLESGYSFMNTLMAAHLSKAELAAYGLVSMLFVTLMVIFWGIFSGISVIISHYHGAQKTTDIIGVMRDGLIASFIFCIPIMLILWYSPILFQWTGQTDFIVSESQKYLHALVWAVPFDLPGIVLMQLFQGISKPKINFLFTVGYIPLLIFSNYCFMFGKFGLPQLELTGVGVGTSVAFFIFFIAMWLFILLKPKYKKYIEFSAANKNKYYYSEIFKTGLPLGLMYCVEIAFFLVLALFMGKFGNTTLAAHQMTIQYFWIFTNTGFSIGQALSIRIGWRLGRQEKEWIMPITWIGQGLTIFYFILTGLLFWLGADFLIYLDLYNTPLLHDNELVAITKTLLKCLAVFQLIDGIRFTFFGILRGMKDTRFTLIASIIQFWIIALPLSYYFAFHMIKSPIGLWIGLIISALVGVAILWRRLLTVRSW
jgi:MATE family multidrug resistance protein